MKDEVYITLAKSKRKKQTNKSKTQQKTKNIESEIRVDFEEVATLDITNISDNDIKEKSSILTYAKKNPEYAAFIFTIITTIAYFLIRMIAFVFFAGQCIYNHVELRIIKVDSDAIIFLTLVALVLGAIVAMISDKMNRLTNRYPVVSGVILLILLFIFFFYLAQSRFPSMAIGRQLLLSVLCSLMILFICIIPAWISRILLHKLQCKVEKEFKKMEYPQNIGVLSIIAILLLLILSFFIGFNLAIDQKKFKTIDEKYVVLYMNDEIAVCSPYIEDNNCIKINKSIHKNFNLDDIEFETKEFDEVK